MSDLFYSQVNEAVQRELKARANAGVNRTTKDLNFMLEKIANVKLTAYRKTDPNPGDEIEDAILGGDSIRTSDYLPTGYLNRPTSRSKPYISSVSIDIKDQTRGYINKGTIKIYIPDPTSDLELIEDTYCKPGRTVLVEIQHPDSAVLSENKLAEDSLVDYSTLLELYPNITEDEIRKLNRVTFNGKISTFSFQYNRNGSVEVTFEMIGTTGTYINVSTYISENIDAKENDEKNRTTQETNTINNFYYQILEDVTNKIKEELGATEEELPQRPIEIKYGDQARDDQNILYGPLYTSNNNNSQQKYDTFISLGLFTQYVNKFILTKIRSTNDDSEESVRNIPDIICNDELCKSIYYSNLASASPKRVLLWPGTKSAGDSGFNVYGADDTNKLIAYESVPPETSGIVDQDGDTKIIRPARIYINIEIIQEFIDEQAKNKLDVTIQSLFNAISEEIEFNTGNAFRIKLAQHPLADSALIYYDTNYYNPSVAIQEFFVPVFASDNGRTIVSDIQISSKVPESIKQLIYGIQAGKTTTQKIALSSAYIYAPPEVQDKLEELHRDNHNDAIKSLNDAKVIFAKQPDAETTYTTLQKALSKYVTYYTPDLKETLNNTKPVYPLEITFTIDGINGFKYGDVLNINGIPKRYSKSFVFMVTGVSHNVQENGEWTTSLNLLARVRL